MDFSEMVAAFIRDIVDGERVLAHQFNCSRPTIKRWASGESRPHPLFREKVEVFIANYGQDHGQA